jgi:hypothetical protein
LTVDRRRIANGRRCEYCAGVGPADGSFCPDCGRPYDPDVRPPEARPPSVDMSVWTAIKIGFGVALGSALFGLLIVAAVALLGAALLHRTFQPPF